MSRVLGSVLPDEFFFLSFFRKISQTHQLDLLSDGAAVVCGLLTVRFLKWLHCAGVWLTVGPMKWLCYHGVYSVSYIKAEGGGYHCGWVPGHFDSISSEKDCLSCVTERVGVNGMVVCLGSFFLYPYRWFPTSVCLNVFVRTVLLTVLQRTLRFSWMVRCRWWSQPLR